MRDRQNILVILTPGFPASDADTTCLPMQQDLVRALNRIEPSLQIVILSLQYPYEKKEYDWLGNRVISFAGRNVGGVKGFLLRRKVMRVLGDIRRSGKIIGILSFWYGECAIAGQSFGRRHGIDHCCWILGQDARRSNRTPRRIALDPSRLVALSDFLRDEFERNHGIRPQWVIPPGIDKERYVGHDARRGIDLLAAGSLIPLKQYGIFLETIHAVRKQRPGIKAVLIGEGPERQRLEEMIARLHLEETVTLTGSLPYPECLSLMQQAKVFLHTSSYEGFSGVCLEAAAAGAQVISFCRPMADDIPHWRIAASPDEMVTMTMEILDDPHVDHGAVTVFDIHETARKMLSLFSYSTGTGERGSG